MVSVKYEPQSLHWSHEHITAVHLKDGGDKSYHTYLSDYKHDKKCIMLVIKLVIFLVIKLLIKLVIKEMLNEADTKNASVERYIKPFLLQCFFHFIYHNGGLLNYTIQSCDNIIIHNKIPFVEALKKQKCSLV